ncbi:hypothetical protein BO70DRAFT_38163 [Aspergillus heteromorphus CBS 117.55]|uniref:Uncharacterized protein n=1 Tax=Aspergillus heteromorphus CBS 117.55 TaxID=1448321 RepID=A0A317W844_9EURO|nr:uncharacterized protein BO70DRAFT_38163 [Aspergillus heteromorphus CBS 117.55]PWY82259.1 hypothetical protein BO70DRAFT_38163 [Aspergillus heteromorphus CBS 117.55]
MMGDIYPASLSLSHTSIIIRLPPPLCHPPTPSILNPSISKTPWGPRTPNHPTNIFILYTRYNNITTEPRYLEQTLYSRKEYSIHSSIHQSKT